MKYLKPADDSVTLIEAQENLDQKIEKGARCECCGQYVKVYKRPLNSTMVREMLDFYMEAGVGKFMHFLEIRNFIERGYAGGGDFQKLAYWGFIEKLPLEESEDKKSSGKWAITERGEAFLKGELTVKSHALVFDGRVLGFCGDDVTIDTIPVKGFSFRELMSA